jgi:hypothetical protein
MKFWISDADQRKLREAHDRIFVSGVDKELYFLIGYFNVWFAACELRITLLLAKYTKSFDIEAFELLTKGLDARTKSIRLREACAPHNLIGPNLNRRLLVFEKTFYDLRNKIAHCFPVSDNDKKSVNFLTLARTPHPLRTKAPKAESMSFDELFEHGAWLDCFNSDLKPLSQGSVHLGRLEIDAPQSPRPKRESAAVDGPRRHSRSARRVSHPCLGQMSTSMVVIDRGSRTTTKPDVQQCHVAATRSGSTQVVLLLDLVSGEAHTMQGFWRIPGKPPTPSRTENRNISPSQITVLRIF